MIEFIRKNKMAREVLYEYALFLPVVIMFVVVFLGVDFFFKNDFTSRVNIQILCFYSFFHVGVSAIFFLFGNKSDIKKFSEQPYAIFSRLQIPGNSFITEHSSVFAGVIFLLMLLTIVFSAWYSFGMILFFLAGVLILSNRVLDILVVSLFGLVVILALSFSGGYKAEGLIIIIAPLFFARLIKSL